jgi:hypothetical protein
VIFIGRNIGMLEGSYAYRFKTLHNVVEFVPDFGQCYPKNEEAELYFRIIKHLLRILQTENMSCVKQPKFMR